MSEASKFANEIGRKKMAEALGVGLTAVSNAVVRKSFPASWIETCRCLAAEKGMALPVHLFGQKGVHSTRSGYEGKSLQAQSIDSTSGEVQP